MIKPLGTKRKYVQSMETFFLINFVLNENSSYLIFGKQKVFEILHPKCISQNLPISSSKENVRITNKLSWKKMLTSDHL